LIVVAGRKFAPADIDLAVSEKLGLPPSRVASYGHINELATESIMIAIETRANDTEQLVQQARAACFERTGILPGKVRICAVGTIPKTTSGKVRREALRNLLEAADGETREVV
jgi:acyl-CoA synthetase (AMP-forming)/AMP-acid ligase II